MEKEKAKKGESRPPITKTWEKDGRTGCLFGGIGNYACHFFFFFFFSNLCSRRGVIMLDNEWIIENKLQHRLHEKTSSLSTIKKTKKRDDFEASFQILGSVCHNLAWTIWKFNFISKFVILCICLIINIFVFDHLL